jgi:hypothetical protein
VLTRDAVSFVKHPAAQNTSTPPSALEDIIRDPDVHYTIKLCAGANPAVPFDALLRLADERTEHHAIKKNSSPETWWDLREDLARHPDVTPEMLTKLASNSAPEVRAIVAANVVTPPDLCRTLAQDSQYSVRAAAARNPSTPPDVLATLATDSDTGIRWMVLNNPALPPNVLAILADDPYDNVRYTVARNHRTSSDTLERLIYNGSPQVQEAVAGNQSTPPHVLRLLGSAGDIIRYSVARNPSTPVDVLTAIVLDATNTYNVRRTAAANPTTPVEVRVRFLASSTDVADLLMLAELSTTQLSAAPQHPAIVHLRESALITAAQHESVTWPDKPRSVYDLPGRGSLPWTTVDPRIAALDNTYVTVGGIDLTVTVLTSRHALRMNATYMGNCTESYAPQIASGDAAMLALRDESGATRYNVELNQYHGDWFLGQVNTRHNRGVKPAEVEAIRAIVPQ